IWSPPEFVDSGRASPSLRQQTRYLFQTPSLFRSHIIDKRTHRIGSAKIADRILVMDQGRIMETGTHDELIKKEGNMQRCIICWRAGI
ncbi:hypothetical protein, partial [Bianquea renquensis]|uniref:hypothetical protein n=1 Tax=Bianquea renquensis TaxID=2763661 RepID=UPI003211A2F3